MCRTVDTTWPISFALFSSPPTKQVAKVSKMISPGATCLLLISRNNSCTSIGDRRWTADRLLALLRKTLVLLLRSFSPHEIVSARTGMALQRDDYGSTVSCLDVRAEVGRIENFYDFFFETPALQARRRRARTASDPRP